MTTLLAQRHCADTWSSEVAGSEGPNSLSNCRTKGQQRADVFKEGNGVEFISIGGDPEALMAYMVKNPGLLLSMQSVKAGDIGKRRKEMAEMIEGTWRSCIEAGNGMGEKISALNVDAPEDLFIADVIIANPPLGNGPYPLRREAWHTFTYGFHNALVSNEDVSPSPGGHGVRRCRDING